MRRTIQLAPLASLLWLASIAAAAAPTYDVHVEKDVMVPMRDGVRLATDVYLPAQDGKPLAERLPTILMRTPYNKAGEKGTPTAEYFAAPRLRGRRSRTRAGATTRRASGTC